MCFQTEALGFQRNRAAAREGIQQGRRVVVRGFHDLSLGFRQNAFVIAVLPFHQARQDVKQALALLLLGFLGGKLLRMAGGIVHQR